MCSGIFGKQLAIGITATATDLTCNAVRCNLQCEWTGGRGVFSTSDSITKRPDMRDDDDSHRWW